MSIRNPKGRTRRVLPTITRRDFVVAAGLAAATRAVRPLSAFAAEAGNVIGAPADHPSVSYPQRRYFFDAQGWWGDAADGFPTLGGAEHLHVGAAFPEGAGAGSYRFDV